MADEDSQSRREIAAMGSEAEVLPDYLTNPNAVAGDEGVQWRFGKAPDYSNTRRVWAEGKHGFVTQSIKNGRLFEARLECMGQSIMVTNYWL